jgi:hypothetical protein
MKIAVDDLKNAPLITVESYEIEQKLRLVPGFIPTLQYPWGELRGTRVPERYEVGCLAYGDFQFGGEVKIAVRIRIKMKNGSKVRRL